MLDTTELIELDGALKLVGYESIYQDSLLWAIQTECYLGSDLVNEMSGENCNR